MSTKPVQEDSTSETCHSCHAAVAIRNGAMRKPVFVLTSIQEDVRRKNLPTYSSIGSHGSGDIGKACYPR
jgi:hypothetical protein